MGMPQVLVHVQGGHPEVPPNDLLGWDVRGDNPLVDELSGYRYCMIHENLLILLRGSRRGRPTLREGTMKLFTRVTFVSTLRGLSLDLIARKVE